LPVGYKKDEIIPEEDVLDTWATSSLTPMINSNFFGELNLNNKILPFSLRPQAHDIIRTWALYTIIMSHYHNKKIPFKNIMISGHVLAPK
jgi:valyl-tRNA synthetase